MQLLHLSQLLLTLPVLGYCALPFFRAAARDLRLMRLGMDVTVTLGIWVAALASLWSIWRGAGPVYFDSISMFVALLLGSRWLQERAMLRASEHLDALARSGVLAALLIEPDGSTRTVPAQALKPGERFLVCAGETVPADGRVIEGSGSCSEALLHGESRPVEKRPGAQVLAGAVNLGDPLIVQVERAGAATVLACLARVAARAGRTRPEIVLFADRAAQGFGAALAVFAIGAALVWAELDATRIIPVEVAILIVTCPCALSLAVPLALAAGQAAMAREGVLVARAAAIETLGAVDTVLVDKTGTLTAGHMSVKTITLCEGAALDARRALELAAALEAGSSHPIACALRRASGVPGPVPTNQRQFAGVGIAACIDGVEYTLGRVDETLARLDLDLPEGDSLAVLGNAKGPLAVFSFGDPVRPSARAFVAHLEALQCEVRVLSGDRASVVAQVAGELNIANWQAGLGPEEKLAAVSALQRAHRVVAMVGDGMNDAAAVAGADTSIALGSGSALTQTRADFIVLGEDLGALERALGIARRTRRIVRQSLAWALGYNLVAIPVAALGSIRPEWAALGMALSSLGVVGNAMRLLARGRLR
jgi:Cu2+-exporting ATPase